MNNKWNEQSAQFTSCTAPGPAYGRHWDRRKNLYSRAILIKKYDCLEVMNLSPHTHNSIKQSIQSTEPTRDTKKSFFCSRLITSASTYSSDNNCKKLHFHFRWWVTLQLLHFWCWPFSPFALVHTLLVAMGSQHQKRHIKRHQVHCNRSILIKLKYENVMRAHRAFQPVHCVHFACASDIESEQMSETIKYERTQQEQKK